jgi:hypothetical protein
VITNALLNNPILQYSVLIALEPHPVCLQTDHLFLYLSPDRLQAAFHVFGMELLTQLDLAATNDFFKTFFALPATYWRGFLGSNLSSAQLLVFALLTFVLAPVNIKIKLVTHLIGGKFKRLLLPCFFRKKWKKAMCSVALNLNVFATASDVRTVLERISADQLVGREGSLRPIRSKRGVNCRSKVHLAGSMNLSRVIALLHARQILLAKRCLQYCAESLWVTLTECL